MWHDLQSNFSASITDVDAPMPQGMVATTERLNIYRNNLAVSLSEALGQAFPVVKILVGDEFFAGMAQVYVQQNKPTSPLLMEYGDTFSTFIAEFPPAASIPYLADIALVEYAWLRAYHAADTDPAVINVLGIIPEDKLDTKIFRLHPSFYLLNSEWPIASIWHAHQENGAPDLSGLQTTPEHMMIVRPQLDVQISIVSEESYAFADALRDGMALGAACEALEDIDGFDPTQHLTELFLAGVITGVITNT
jgi:hypothetical protein